MRTSVIGIVVAAIALLGLGAYVVLTYEGGSGTAVATSTIAETTDDYEIDVQYPQFGIPAVDAQIKAIYDQAVSELKASPVVMHDMTAATNSFTGRFDKVFSGPDLISAELILSSYTGGAHPSTLFTGVVFDRSGKRLTLDDALALTGKSLSEVSESARTQLREALGDGFMFTEGADPKPENYSSFVVDSTSVTFIMQQYQVAAYAAGQQYVVVPRVR